MENRFGLPSTANIAAATSLIDTKFEANNARGGIVHFSDCLVMERCTFNSVEQGQSKVTAAHKGKDLLFSPDGELSYQADGKRLVQSQPLADLDEGGNTSPRNTVCQGILTLSDPWIDGVRQVHHSSCLHS